jgi:hypothetical protein
LRVDKINRSLAELKSVGFEGFRRIGDLFLSCFDVPDASGIYLVLYLNEDHPKFVSEGVGGFFKGRNPNVSEFKLEENWVNDTIVIYIGQTEDSLNRRITRYMDFGKGKPVGHYGGRYIWQIQDYCSLVVGWKACPEGFDSRKIEGEFMRRFKRIHGRLPFANLRE